MLARNLWTLLLCPGLAAAAGPFLKQINESAWVFGNDLWNLTQGPVFANKLFYKSEDLVKSYLGHYSGWGKSNSEDVLWLVHNGGVNNLRWLNASIVARGSDWADISFTSEQGDLHWVVFEDLAGAYQYFTNRALEAVQIWRTVWQLDPTIFLNGRTNIKDQALPDFSLYTNATKVQDETFLLADGTYLTKYDFADFVRDRDFHGVYGPDFGSWYIHPSYESWSSNQLSQGLTVHRESSVGSAVQLNVIQDTSHFRVTTLQQPASGKIFGPWLWYLNNGSVKDAKKRQEQEGFRFPYSWFNNSAYQSRGEVAGSLRLSDGRPASGASVFLGDTNTTTQPIVQGINYYYTTTTDESGYFRIPNVRTGRYELYAWSNGGVLYNVYTNVTCTDVTVAKDKLAELGNITWDVPKGRSTLFQIGDFDRKAYGFRNGGLPYQHGLSDKSPANLTYTVGRSNVSDWYYAQSANGTWTIEFDGGGVSEGNAILSVSLAGHSKGPSLVIDINGQRLDTLTPKKLANDAALYRSGRVSGEWRFLQYNITSDQLYSGIHEQSCGGIHLYLLAPHTPLVSATECMIDEDEAFLKKFIMVDSNGQDIFYIENSNNMRFVGPEPAS
ncbi:rhamnogalacturonate lyase [Grosmannia clavigera kw1407]|uniref:rhamnogalacturonan endolyase n=1 Tax=Grosmannia clavigera (strain kw1407 / UAMH 11150) TaxID=655863 RepID=F0X7U6_GROCL|nr:rhamnogalacturonate lyase [Grosmannia clavigera kw1407]EFX06471.1 rhamnogalacturonate lyase [Grosmannia clavigera kw1407]